MKKPAEVWNFIKVNCKSTWKAAFISAVMLGLLIHMPMMLRDIPNHDGLDSMHFDQNMVISGRWFLSIACGFSSYYTLPWLIGILSVLFLGLAAVVLVDFLEIKHNVAAVLVSGLLVSYPALSSTFAYLFTMDGYMLAVFLAILAVWLTKRSRLGFVAGAISLAFSLGIYQAYLPFAVLLSLYGIVLLFMNSGDIKDKLFNAMHYLYMGVFGTIGYYVILQIMLKLQNKEIGSYQDGNSVSIFSIEGILSTVQRMYTDFAAFTIKGNVLINNIFSLLAVFVLVMLAVITFVKLSAKKCWWKSPWFYLVIVAMLGILPMATNIILLILPQVTYHVLMRYQWVLYPILLVAFISRWSEETEDKGIIEWGMLLGAGVLVWNFTVTDQIAYSNLEKKYEKTYAYCVRLLDRIEQTEGYYQGIPIAMIGVVGDVPYPQTDITLDVTAPLIGMNGDELLYTGNNYELFIKHYLGATLNILPADAMEEMYYSDAYREMESFPGKDSIKVIDGIMYIKTENRY